jgi:hypothetical protein
MHLDFDASALRAVLTADDNHWVLAIEHSTGGSWGHADASWTRSVVSRDELRSELGDEVLSHEQDIVGFIETTLRRSGWRAERSGDPVDPPTLEVWDLSPASDYR